MTKTGLTTEYLLRKEELVPFVEILQNLVAGGFILTMTIRRCESEESSAFAVTLHSEDTLR